MCEICSFLNKNLPLQEKAQKLVEYELRNLPLQQPCPALEALQIWIWKIRFCDSTTPRKVHKYLFFPVQNKSFRKKDFNKFLEMERFIQVDRPRKKSVFNKTLVPKYPETNFQPLQATKRFHNFWTYSVTHREVVKNFILRYEMPGDQLTYLEPRLLTIKDVAVKDTRSGRSDRTTNIRCSSLHAFSHSPVEEIDRQRTWKGRDPKSTVNSTTFV